MSILSWSPKGDRIAYASMAGSQFDIYTVSVKSGEVQRLTFGGRNESPDFSPDGRMIIFSSARQGRSALYVMNANGANPAPDNVYERGADQPFLGAQKITMNN